MGSYVHSERISLCLLSTFIQHDSCMCDECGTGNNVILKMLALPVNRYALSAEKFCLLLFYLFMEMVVFLVVFVITGLISSNNTGNTEALPILYLLKWCAGLFLPMLPNVATM